MSDGLLELKKEMEKPAPPPKHLLALLENSGGVNDRTSSGYKRRYFIKNVDLIFELIEKHSVRYEKIVQTINEDDGVEFSLIYFKKLVATEKKRRALK